MLASLPSFFIVSILSRRTGEKRDLLAGVFFPLYNLFLLFLSQISVQYIISSWFIFPQNCWNGRFFPLAYRETVYFIVRDII